MQKDDATWLRTAYVAAAFIFGLIFWKAIMFAGLKSGWLERFDASYNVGSTIAAGLLAVICLWLLVKDRERNDYFLASIGELRKVSWPSWENTKKLTWIVVIVVAIFSAILTVFDLACAKILKLLLA
ncbi:MAG: preprotein translocase subunit SecE [Proteobacteria bacterium]|nr:preprotein translocase subunit SecE [Pseudomonadota bacterium]